jgi:hypothetical protein
MPGTMPNDPDDVTVILPYTGFVRPPHTVAILNGAVIANEGPGFEGKSIVSASINVPTSVFFMSDASIACTGNCASVPNTGTDVITEMFFADKNLTGANVFAL